jgi:hypothetical protein
MIVCQQLNLRRKSLTPPLDGVILGFRRQQPSGLYRQLTDVLGRDAFRGQLADAFGARRAGCEVTGHSRIDPGQGRPYHGSRGTVKRAGSGPSKDGFEQTDPNQECTDGGSRDCTRRRALASNRNPRFPDSSGDRGFMHPGICASRDANSCPGRTGHRLRGSSHGGPARGEWQAAPVPRTSGCWGMAAARTPPRRRW